MAFHHQISFLAGTLTPLFSILFGNLINSVGKNSDDLMMEVNRCVLLLLSLSCAALLAGYIETSMASFSGKHPILYFTTRFGRNKTLARELST